MVDILTGTHVFIGKKIFESIDNESKDFSKLINKKYFLYGNIKPDCLFQDTPSHHKREEALSYVVEKINELKVYNLDTQEDINRFSLELGIICHFLADFYCKPHVRRWGDYTGFKRSIKGVEHIFYEFKIGFYKGEVNRVISSKYHSINNHTEFIRDTFVKYEEDINLKKDIYYATFACRNIVLYILKEQASV